MDIFDDVADFQMLEVAPISERPHARMPVDFSPYLLSASPPATGFDFISYSLSPSWQNFMPLVSPHENWQVKEPVDNTSHNSPSINGHKGPLKPIICKSDTQLANISEEESSPTPTSPTSPGRIRKRVSFADQSGMALATVRILSEPSDVPPRLKAEVLAHLTQGAQAGATGKPPLKLTFSQPASEYMAFREKLEYNKVSLENVILKDYDVVGTIKVKNISFEKRVFVRFTCDAWETHTDVPALFTPGPSDGSGLPSIYDTFTFRFEVPPTCDRSSSVQFAVCFNAEQGQFWDNNSGNNYVIVFETFDRAPGILNFNSNMPEFGPSSLTDYAAWHHADTSVPYW